MPQIEVRQLSRFFKVPERESSFKAALASLFNRRYREVRAVDDISFSIEQGEIVGFLGPNGAGKTTTLKMLAGLLHPTGGTASVFGYTPWRREADYLSRISMVMGQRSQLLWDLPAMDSFRVQLAVYRVDKTIGKQTLDEMIAMLDIGDVLKKQVRTLSLGERMKCEICLSLLHRPAVLFLDEPTLGLDVTMQGRIREFVAEYNRRYGATIILTSHYMADVTALCKRIVVIDHGKILFDGPLAELGARLAPFKVITIDLESSPDGYNFESIGEVCARKDQKVSIRVPRERAPELAGRLLTELPVRDVTVEDPPIEDVIKMVFAGGMEQKP